MDKMPALRIHSMPLAIIILLTIHIEEIVCAMPSSMGARRMCKTIGGVPSNLMTCPTGQGIKTVGRYHCCVQCHSRCIDTSHARVLDGEASTGCFGDCVKCSTVSEPYKHYKNVDRGRCEQCMDCRRLGKVEVRSCSDIQNTECVDRFQLTTSSAYTSIPTTVTDVTETNQKDFDRDVPADEDFYYHYKVAVLAILIPVVSLLVFLAVLVRKIVTASKTAKAQAVQFEMDVISSSSRPTVHNIYSEEPEPIYSQLLPSGDTPTGDRTGPVVQAHASRAETGSNETENPHSTSWKRKQQSSQRPPATATQHCEGM